jgi:hypothetical protein
VLSMVLDELHAAKLTLRIKTATTPYARPLNAFVEWEGMCSSDEFRPIREICGCCRSRVALRCVRN